MGFGKHLHILLNRKQACLFPVEVVIDLRLLSFTFVFLDGSLSFDIFSFTHGSDLPSRFFFRIFWALRTITTRIPIGFFDALGVSTSCVFLFMKWTTQCECPANAISMSFLTARKQGDVFQQHEQVFWQQGESLWAAWTSLLAVEQVFLDVTSSRLILM
jgi:hypothetical protein